MARNKQLVLASILPPLCCAMVRRLARTELVLTLEVSAWRADASIAAKHRLHSAGLITHRAFERRHVANKLAPMNGALHFGSLIFYVVGLGRKRLPIVKPTFGVAAL